MIVGGKKQKNKVLGGDIVVDETIHIHRRGNGDSRDLSDSDGGC